MSGTYASQFAVSGLSAVHGAAQKLKSEMKRLAAFSLETKEDDLEFGVGQQGPEIKAKSTGKSINYWGLANIVNVNSALLSPELYDVTLNCRYVWRAPFKVPDTKAKYGSLTLTYASQLHIARSEQRPALARTLRCNAELPLRLARALQGSGHQSKVRQSHPDLRVAIAHCRHRGGSRNFCPEDSRLRRRRRLRHRNQSPDRRRPGLWCDRARDRRGADGNLRLRRRRQHADQHLQRLHADYLREYSQDQVRPYHRS